MGPSESAVKYLFAHSRNLCFFNLPGEAGCEQTLTERHYERTNGEIAHICSPEEHGPRFDPKLSAKDQQAEPNLMLLCPGCHKRVDYLERSRFSAEELRDMKNRHVAADEGSTFDPGTAVERAVATEMIRYFAARSGFPTAIDAQIDSTEDDDTVQATASVEPTSYVPPLPKRKPAQRPGPRRANMTNTPIINPTVEVTQHDAATAV